MISKKDQERYLELSKNIKSCIDEISKLEKESKNRDEEKNEIEDTNSRLRNKEEEIEKLIKTVIGQMYEGVLVSDTLTIRRGKIFPYRCQYNLSCQNALNDIIRYESEARTKLGENKWELIMFLSNIFKGVSTTRNEIERINIKEELDIEPITFWENNYETSGEYKIVTKIMIDRSGLNLFDGSGGNRNRGEREININNINIIEERYKEEIAKMSEKVLNAYKEIEKKLDNWKTEIEEKGGKFLIASTLCQ